ncbi:aspartyl/asparaginyl beta-hydroxylase domain-containing protein [Pseudomonadota bacterium]
MKNVVKIPVNFDADKLLSEVKYLESVMGWLDHWNNDYHSGNWQSIPLYSVGGRCETASIRPGKGDYEPTPGLKKSTYLPRVINWFQCEKTRVRLMKLDSGAEIFEHRDPGFSWHKGKIRVHIPIKTNGEVSFIVESEEVRMAAGEVWYCDFSRPHRLKNSGDEPRIHLVIDLIVNDWVRSLFPRENIRELIWNWLFNNLNSSVFSHHPAFAGLRKTTRRLLNS